MLDQTKEHIDDTYEFLIRQTWTQRYIPFSSPKTQSIPKFYMTTKAFS